MIYRSQVALLTLAGDRHSKETCIEESSRPTDIEFDRARERERWSASSSFTAVSSPSGPLRRADRRWCTPFLYPNNLQSTAWHRTLLRNIVISPQLLGLFSTAYLAGARGCARPCLHVDPDTWRLCEKRWLPAEVRT